MLPTSCAEVHFQALYAGTIGDGGQFAANPEDGRPSRPSHPRPTTLAPTDISLIGANRHELACTLLKPYRQAEAGFSRSSCQR